MKGIKYEVTSIQLRRVDLKREKNSMNNKLEQVLFFIEIEITKQNAKRGY